MAATPDKRLSDQFAPLDRSHQEAFVATVRDIARAAIFLSIGVVLGVAFAWINGLGRKK
jgi:hypothetical protein